jgi:hypothetical protein
MKTRLVIRDNTADEGIELITDLPEKDVGFLNRVGDLIWQETGCAVTFLALEPEG